MNVRAYSLISIYKYSKILCNCQIISILFYCNSEKNSGIFLSREWWGSWLLPSDGVCPLLFLLRKGVQAVRSSFG